MVCDPKELIWRPEETINVEVDLPYFSKFPSNIPTCHNPLEKDGLSWGYAHTQDAYLMLIGYLCGTY